MSNAEEWVPPKVWTDTTDMGGRYGAINRPTAGPREERVLPVGEHAFQLYSLGTPNGQKVTILLEELLAAGYAAEYDAWYIDIGQGDQFGSGFVDINPNSKIPAFLDRSVTPAQRVFESGSILVYLAEHFGAFLPTERAARTEVLNWLFWQMGSAPFVGGGFGHFYAYAPTKQQYPIDRYAMETKRQLDVLNRQLEERPFIAGDAYSIADMAIWPWYGQLVLGSLYGAAEFLSVDSYTHVLRWAKELAARPGVIRGRMINRPPSNDAPGLRERHCAADVDAALAAFTAASGM